MIKIRKFIKYIVDNGAYHKTSISDCYKIELDNGYKVEYEKIGPLESIHLYTKDYWKTFSQEGVKELENKLNEYKDIYRVIDHYEMEDELDTIRREREMWEVEKLFKGE